MGIKPRRRITDLYEDGHGRYWKRPDVYDNADEGFGFGVLFIYVIYAVVFLVVGVVGRILRVW